MTATTLAGMAEAVESVAVTEGQRPLELILARNLMAGLSTPAFLVDEDAVVVFYNEAAGILLGRRFEEAGRMRPEEWSKAFGPIDAEGKPLAVRAAAAHDRAAARAGPPTTASGSSRSTDGEHEIEVSAIPIVDRRGHARRDGDLLADRTPRDGLTMQVKVWGARGSVPSPGPETTRYGGNTSCVQVTLSDGTIVVLDAGTGLRSLGLALNEEPARVNILLTHLHLDHIQGLMFFAPAFRPEHRARDLGAGGRRGLARGPDRAATSRRRCRRSRCASCPATCRSARRPHTEWQIGPATLRAASVTHRGPTLGYRITEGDTSVCYIPDHEPALGARSRDRRARVDLRLRARARERRC